MINQGAKTNNELNNINKRNILIVIMEKIQVKIKKGEINYY